MAQRTRSISHWGLFAVEFVGYVDEDIDRLRDESLKEEPVLLLPKMVYRPLRYTDKL